MFSLARRIVRPALFIQAAISIVVGILVFLVQLPALPKAEPILSTRVGDLTIALGVLCALAAVMLPRDRSWLLVPMTLCGAEFANTLVQAIIKGVGAHVRTDPQLAQPLITYGVFLLIYATAYLALSDRPARSPAAPA
jgi:hypothetical protein